MQKHLLNAMHFTWTIYFILQYIFMVNILYDVYILRNENLNGKCISLTSYS